MRSISSSKTSDGKLLSLHMWVQNNHSTGLGIYLVVQHHPKNPNELSIENRSDLHLMADTMPTHKHAAVRVLWRGVSFSNLQVRNIVPTATVIVLRA
jgi:hypothetical protein